MDANKAGFCYGFKDLLLQFCGCWEDLTSHLLLYEAQLVICVYLLTKRQIKTYCRPLETDSTMPNTLAYPSGVSFFFNSHSPHWPLLPSSLGLCGLIQDKVMLLAYVLNLPPDPRDACRDLACWQSGSSDSVVLKHRDGKNGWCNLVKHACSHSCTKEHLSLSFY